ncbi:GNAT family N-acetyltransferase [Maribacter sp. 2307ULW6-5]|uniref:GNAT family N-acetyltransferase n=1 Tax=Maribacter sp. 2307ULW6-5 TaxID=3386275 RepID=UPI0039BD5B2B
MSSPLLSELKEKEEWTGFLDQFGAKDVYHTYDYHHLAKGSAQPVLLAFEQGGCAIALPLLIRQIEGTPFFDATSVYGYAGPLFRQTSPMDIHTFQKEFIRWCEEHDIVSVFTRMNPYIPDQNKIVAGLGNIILQGKVVNIDTTIPDEDQWTQYQRRLKGQVNRARRECSVEDATTDAGLDVFISIYNENMKRVGAQESYFFDKPYYQRLMNSTDFKCTLLLARCRMSQEPIAGSMFISHQDKTHYHLGGTRTEFLPLMPSKLLIDEMRRRAKESGQRYFNLGGGLSGRHDSLFTFKASFSNDHKDFYLWNLIVNQEIYDKLSVGIDKTAPLPYFPLYRSNARLTSKRQPL